MTGNLFSNLPALPAQDEQFLELFKRPGLRIERIVSTGQASPDGFWYDQPEEEWVLLLQGEARILFEDTPDILALLPGDFLEIAPHRRHRVEWTHPTQATVWLAIHHAPGGVQTDSA